MAEGAGLPPGTYQVSISPPVEDLPLGPVQASPQPKEYPNIPERYRDPQTSGLTLRVRAEANRLDVDMQP